MSNLRHSSPFTPEIRLRSEGPVGPLISEETKLKDAEAAIQELKSLELLPLVLDIVEDVNAGKLLPKDVENAAGTIRVRINKARDIIKNIHGLSETPEERAVRVERLKKNISRKSDALQRFREKVAQKITLPDPPTPEPEIEEVKEIPPIEKEPEQEQQEPKQEETPVETNQDGDVLMEDQPSTQDQPEVREDSTEFSNLQSQPLQQSDTLATEDVNFDFMDFPPMGSTEGDINMD